MRCGCQQPSAPSSRLFLRDLHTSGSRNRAGRGAACEGGNSCSLTCRHALAAADGHSRALLPCCCTPASNLFPIGIMCLSPCDGWSSTTDGGCSSSGEGPRRSAQSADAWSEQRGGIGPPGHNLGCQHQSDISACRYARMAGGPCRWIAPFETRGTGGVAAPWRLPVAW